MGALERIDLKAIVKKYGCINFIETGTGWGNGLAIASSLPFMNIYSIEIAPARARAVSDRFLDDTRINVMTSSSVVGLRKIFDECSTETPFLFWLDAHFPDYAGDGDDWNRELNESALKNPHALDLSGEFTDL